MKKLILAALLVVLAAVGAYFFYGKPELPGLPSSTPPEPPPVAKVERRDMEYDIRASGDIAPLVQVDVKAEISGRINKIAVVVGETVKQGQRLLELDDRDLKTDKAGAEVEIAGARLALEKNQRGYDRAQKLYQRQLLSQELFENSKTDVDTAKNDFEKAQSKLRIVNDKLEKTKIVAPFDGTILGIPVVEGQVVIGAASVNSGSVLFSFADLTRMQITSHINQVDISKLKPQQNAAITVDSVKGLEISGKLVLISPIATIRNNIKGFSVMVAIANPDPRLKPGMTADLVFPVSTASRALSVPLGAIFTEEDDKKVVYIAGASPESKPEKRTVEVGIVNYNFAEIKSGVNEGETVLLTKPQDARGG